MAELNQVQALELAARILHMGKSIVPDRFPQQSQETAEEWALIIGRMTNIPPAVWPEAVRLWATEHAGDRMITLKELKQSAKEVLQRWERDPVRGPQLRAHWAHQEALRDQQIKDGTFAALRGIQVREIEGPARPERIDDLKRRALDAIRRGKERHDGSSS